MKELQPWEALQDRQPFAPTLTPAMRSKKAVLQEILAPCGRFGSAATWNEKMAARISGEILKLDAFGDESFLVTRGTPLNWQLLVDHLHEAGITPSETFSHRWIPNDLPRRFWVDLAGADISEKTDGRAMNPYGAGRSATLEESMSKAVGELLERYFLSIYRVGDLREMSYEKAARSGRALNIRNLNGFLPWQQERHARFVRDETKPMYWTKGFEALSNTRALIPAQLVFWSYRFPSSSPEPYLMEPNTNGCAGHFSRDEAVLAALLEIIQRDGFMIYWLNNLSPAVLDVSTITDEESLDLIREMRRYGLDFFFLNTTTDLGVPSCTCAIVDSSGEEPIISVGASAGFTERDLIFQSAGEALMALGRSLGDRFDLGDRYEAFTDSRVGRDERLKVWYGQEMFERFKFFVSGPVQTMPSFLGGAVAYETPAAKLGYVFEQLRKKGEGYECYWYEVKDPLLTKLNYHVVRTIVPKLMHLYLVEPNATLDAERLHTVPPLLGYKAAETLNPWPHPFP